MPNLSVSEAESIVVREVADKTLSLGCKIILPKPNYPYIHTFTDIENIPIGNDKYGNKYIIYFDRASLIFIKELIDIEILWHEIRPHHILLRIREQDIWLTCDIDYLWYMNIEAIIWPLSEMKTRIQRDLSKPYSGQSDETKIALAELVQSVTNK